MQILLRNTTTGKYLADGGKWVDSSEAAKPFPDEKQAREYFTFRKLPNVTVARVPAPGEAEAPSSKPTPTPKTVVPRELEPSATQSQRAEPGISSASAQKEPPVKTTSQPEPGRAELKATRSGAQEQVNATPGARLTVVEARIDVGFGNSLFIRGQGAGLSWEKGQPLTCTSGTKWVWPTTQAKDKVVFKLLLNDQVWAQGEDTVIEAGQKVELAPAF